MVEITGNTYAVKDRIKALGGRWSSARKCWMVPEAVAEQVRAFVKPMKGVGRAPRACKDCGAKINYGVYCGKCEYR